MRRKAAGAASIFFDILTLASVSAGSSDSKSRYLRGCHRSSFVLPTTTGSTASLKAKRGHIVLVHFFDTCCEPCRDELPALAHFAARNRNTVKFFAISVAEVDVRVKHFIDSTSIDFPVLLDLERTVAREWKVSALPTTFVLDEDLKPQLVVETDFDWDRLDPSKLIKILADNAAEIAPLNALYRSL